MTCRYEGRIVQEMVRADGGKGDFVEVTPATMGIWDTLLKVVPDPGPQLKCQCGCNATIFRELIWAVPISAADHSYTAVMPS